MGVWDCNPRLRDYAITAWGIMPLVIGIRFNIETQTAAHLCPGYYPNRHVDLNIPPESSSSTVSTGTLEAHVPESVLFVVTHELQ